MITGILTEDEIVQLEGYLKTNGGMSETEYVNLKRKHPNAITRDTGLIRTDMKHYGLHDHKFNEFLMTRFGRPEYELDFVYELTYNKGDESIPHRDRKFVVQTTLILLEDNFIGGRLYVNEKDMEFHKRYMYINFDGSKDLHSVSKIEEGQRRVLVVMFNDKKTLI